MSKKKFEEIYEEFCENSESAPERVKSAYQAMHDAFEEYLCAVEEWTFRKSLEFALDYAAKTEISRKAV